MDYSIHLCAFCGEKGKGKFCSSCRTADSRKEKVLEQLAIDYENLEKGHKLPSIIFGLPREEVEEKVNWKG